LGDRLHQLREFKYVPIHTTVNMRFSRDVHVVSSEKPIFSTVGLVSTPDDDISHMHRTTYSMLHLLEEKETTPEEIIVDPPTVSELLSQIKEMQAPRARELLKKENTFEKRVEAKIITFG
jgi:hypothetical protein